MSEYITKAELCSELCKSCIHHKVCSHDKNIVGDIFVAGNPAFFNNRKLYEDYKAWEAAGFPCKDYIFIGEEN